jgi:hypothetical protein
MHSLSTQLHALADELSKVISLATEEEDIHFVMLGGVPFSVREISRDVLCQELTRAAAEVSPPSLFLSLEKPNIEAGTRMAFYDKNPNGIIVDAGRLTEDSLKQSAVSTKTCDSLTYSLAKKIAKELKKISSSGVTAIDDTTGARHLYKSFRFTDGAKKLEMEGIRMMPFAGGARLMLGDATNGL